MVNVRILIADDACYIHAHMHASMKCTLCLGTSSRRWVGEFAETQKAAESGRRGAFRVIVKEAKCQRNVQRHTGETNIV